MSDSMSKMLRVVSTIGLGYFVGSTLHRVMVVQPALIEQDISVAAMTMRGILRHSVSMPIPMTIASIVQLSKYYMEYDTPKEDKFDLCCGCIMFAFIPFTLGKICPLNNKFLDDHETFQNDDSKWIALLSEWSRLHYGCATVALFLFSGIVYKAF